MRGTYPAPHVIFPDYLNWTVTLLACLCARVIFADVHLHIHLYIKWECLLHTAHLHFPLSRKNYAYAKLKCMPAFVSMHMESHMQAFWPFSSSSRFSLLYYRRTNWQTRVRIYPVSLCGIGLSDGLCVNLIHTHPRYSCTCSRFSKKVPSLSLFLKSAQKGVFLFVFCLLIIREVCFETLAWRHH